MQSTYEAVVRVLNQYFDGQCSIRPKFFTDLLTLILVDGRWQIISKVFHFELEPDVERR